MFIKRLTTLLLLLTCLLPLRAQNSLFFASDKLSSTLISCICQDKAGYIWIGTDYGLNRFDGYRFTTYLNHPEDTTSLNYNVVVSVFSDRDGRLWVGTSRGLQRYDYATDHFENLPFPDGVQPRVNDIFQRRDGVLLAGTAGYGLYQLKESGGKPRLEAITDYQQTDRDQYFSHIFEDAQGHFWKSGTDRFGFFDRKTGKAQTFTTAYGAPTDFFDFGGKTVAVCRDRLLVYDGQTMSDDYFDLSAADGKAGYRTVLKDHAGNIYVGTRGNGLYWMPAGTRRLVRHPATVQGFDLNAAKIWALAEDSKGNIWVGCQQKGLLMIPNRKAQFSSWSFAAQKVDIGTCVSSISEGDLDDSGPYVWTTVENKGVYGFDRQGRIVAHPQAPADVDFIYRDKQKAYWIGTSHGVYAYDPQKGTSQLLCDQKCDRYNDMTDDGRGHLVLSAFSKGIVVYDRNSRSLTSYSMMQPTDEKLGRLCNDWVMTLMPDHEGRVWIGTSSGVCALDAATGSFRPYGWDTVVDAKACYSLCETRQGDILIGTEQGLYVWRREDNKAMPYPGAEALQNLVISYIVQDNQGDIWCSTSVGIWHYHHGMQRWLSYVNGSGLTAREYVCSAGLHHDDDRIFFATSDGLTTFTPKQVHEVKADSAEVLLTGFYLDGHAVSTLTRSNGTRVTVKPVTESDHFAVSYLDNTIDLEFSLLNYSNAANTVFEYRLNGAREWTVGREGHNVVTLSHLASGTYQLEVRAIDNGVVSPTRTYTIVVNAPWYRTTLAYVVYLLLLIGAVYLIGHLWRRQERQKLDEDKMKFLINATHDIRSPLTLIMSPLQKLRSRALDSESLAELAVIDRNAQRILSLVNQILDVRKIDKQQMHLHCRETDMQKFISIIYKVYEYNAQERGINFTFQADAAPDGDAIKAWIDRTQFDKVVSNLLSNAFKYSFDHGDITVRLTQGHDDHAPKPLRDYVEISVTDTGTGLREDTIQHIFDRFYQAKTSKASHIQGTGIGLNLCKMIVDMHKGTITAANRQDGVQGSVFTVRLPLGNGHLAPEEIDLLDEQPATTRVSSKKQPRSAYRVLIVDDDEEIGRYIAQELGEFYHFAVCYNGKDGLHELLTHTAESHPVGEPPYDLVISDVMMPEMDGFTMLRSIKSNVNISHLPVILLTSKTDIGNRLEGLERGADAYLNKPFSMDELHATIDNLIASRLRLKGKFSGAQQPTEKVAAPEVKGNDEQLMERIMKSINEHLSDSDFNVDQLCEEVGISRAHLHRKMKDLTGIPVSEFIRNIRLEQGARLLKEQKLNITQVAYTVGFSNLGYFSTIFRKHFGVSPREFVERES